MGAADTKGPCTQDFRDALQFIQALDNTRDDKSGTWLYRGQSDARLGLVPSAWRSSQKNETAPIARMSRVLADWSKPAAPLRDAPHERAVFLQAMAEIALVSAFVALTDELGIPVPDHELTPQPYDPANRAWVMRVRELAQPYDYDSARDVWNPRASSFAANGAFALAQHHGIPTRLLDFTRDPWVAAYFAAESVDVSAGGELAVWAVRSEDFQRSRAIALCQVPRSENSFLHAQSGLFMLHQAGDAAAIERGEYPDLLTPLCALGDDVVRKFTLPHAQIPELSRLLWRRRVSRAHLMPTYDSVTAALKRQWELLGS